MCDMCHKYIEKLICRFANVAIECIESGVSLLKIPALQTFVAQLKNIGAFIRPQLTTGFILSTWSMRIDVVRAILSDLFL